MNGTKSGFSPKVFSSRQHRENRKPKKCKFYILREPGNIPPLQVTKQIHFRRVASQSFIKAENTNSIVFYFPNKN